MPMTYFNFFGIVQTSLKDDKDAEEGQDIKVAKVILHERYSSKSRLNDIALLKLDQPARLAHNIWPACVSSKANSVIPNLTIIGFGVINNDDRKVLTIIHLSCKALMVDIRLRLDI